MYFENGIPVNLVVVTGSVVREAVVNGVVGYDHALPSLAELTPARPLRCLQRPLSTSNAVTGARKRFAGNLFQFDACSTGYSKPYISLANIEATAKKRYTRRAWITGTGSDQP